MTRIVVSILLTFMLASCVSQVDPDFPYYKGNVVINSLLVPDSVIRVHISESVKSDLPEIFPTIINAKVEITGEKKVFQLVHQGQGFYEADVLPVSGVEYRLGILFPDESLVTATTKVPINPKIYTTALKESNLVKVTIEDNLNERNFYWVGMKERILTSDDFFYETYVYSDLLLFDDFNRTRDSEVREGIAYSYHFFARLDDGFFNGSTVSFNIPRKWPRSDDIIDYALYVYIINADKHLDQYMKSALIQYELGVIGDMPVFHTPLDIYSNIENGKGIFGSYTISQFDITVP